MASNSEEEEILEAVVAGIPRVAEAVASIPKENRARVLDATERSYRQTARDLGYEEGLAEGWISAIMRRLQAEVKEQESAKQKMLKTLHEEPVQAETDLDDNVMHVFSASNLFLNLPLLVTRMSAFVRRRASWPR